MTELFLAYESKEGFSNDQLFQQNFNDMNSDNNDFNETKQKKISSQPQIQSPPQSLPQLPQPPPVQQSQPIANFSNKVNEGFYNYYEQIPQQSKINYQSSMQPQYSFWDRMVMSKREVLKLFILSLVVILGISLEKIGCHYVYQYIESNDLSYYQELLIRFSFPICIFLILWIIKSL